MQLLISKLPLLPSIKFSNFIFVVLHLRFHEAYLSINLCMLPGKACPPLSQRHSSARNHPATACGSQPPGVGCCGAQHEVQYGSCRPACAQSCLPSGHFACSSAMLQLCMAPPHTTTRVLMVPYTQKTNSALKESYFHARTLEWDF